MNSLKLWTFIVALCVAFTAYSAERHDHEDDSVMVSNNMAGKDAEGARDNGEERHTGGHKSEGEKSDGGEHEEDGHGHGHGEGASDAELSTDQLRLAGIETMTVERGLVGEAITAPGEVMLNAYRTTLVTPRIAAQVTRRHVRLGDHVTKGQVLVTLSSVEMAEAQGVLLEADVEWWRVKRLGRKVVSEKRFIAAQVAHQQAIARVRAFGMTAKQVNALLKAGDASRATGEFKLLAVQDGTVIRDDFVVGELIDPGRPLFQITDESLLWVEARLTPQEAAGVALGAPARIKVADAWLSGKVTQARHALDEATRTLAVRIEVANPNDHLHPGQFVTAVIEGSERQEVLAVPTAAVLRGADGDWQVFVETAAGRFEPKEVEVVGNMGDRMIIEGLDEGTTIVSKGAFFIQSEIAKSGFEVHNH